MSTTALVIAISQKVCIKLFWYINIVICISAELDCPYQRTENAYPRYLDTIVNSVKNEVACEVTCTFYELFVCRSFAFYASASQCFLSGDDKGNISKFICQIDLLSEKIQKYILRYLLILLVFYLFQIAI